MNVISACHSFDLINFTVSMRILNECVSGVRNANGQFKVDWITAHNYGKPKLH